LIDKRPMGATAGDSVIDFFARNGMGEGSRSGILQRLGISHE